MSIPEVAIIANPHSGAYDPSILKSLAEGLSEFGPSVSVTEMPGHAAELSRSLPSGSWIVSLGGDGTINEIVNGISGTDKILVPFPGGTGSDLVKTTGILTVQSAASAIREGRYEKMDSVRVTLDGRSVYFANILEIGFGASVMQRVNSMEKRGKRAFSSSVMRELPRLKSYRLDFESDGFTGNVDTVETVVANARYFGGGMLASPDSLPDDGLMDVHIVRKISRFRLFLSFGKMKSGKYVSMKEVRNFSARKLIITGDPSPVEADGEYLGESPVTIEVVPGSLRIVRDRSS